VTLISANVSLTTPAGVDLVLVGSTAELREATLLAAVRADAVVMAAAPADFRPATVADQKIKKTADGVTPVIELVANPDIAAELGAAKLPGQVLVAFAAETHDALAHGTEKLRRKRADLIVINEVGVDKVFGHDDTSVTVVDADGSTTHIADRPKDEVADAVLDIVAERWKRR
jgi:phosphopantothenoylcysteine decarboxylase / phosphopantothenate---cysteine ligase